MIEESILQMNQYLSELGWDQKRQLREHDQLLEMVSSYQSSIMDLEEALKRKDPETSRVKKIRFRYEDRIDEIIDFIKEKYAASDLVEELTSMAVDEAGWDGDWSEIPNERARLSVVNKTPYTKAGEETEEDRESPKSVADLISTSSHSLHIFREEYA
jgi:hypothetical protein